MLSFVKEEHWETLGSFVLLYENRLYLWLLVYHGFHIEIVYGTYHWL